MIGSQGPDVHPQIEEASKPTGETAKGKLRWLESVAKKIAPKLKQKNVGQSPESEKSATSYSQIDLAEKILERGHPPIDFVINKIAKGVRIVGIGEVHRIKGQFDMLFELLNNIEQRSATNGDIPQVGTIALEIDDIHQKAVDAFMQTGDRRNLRLLLRQNKLGFIDPHNREMLVKLMETVRVLNSQRDEDKIRIACIDHIPLRSIAGHMTKYLNIAYANGSIADSENRERDIFMHKRLLEITSQDSEHVTIAFLGADHISSRNLPIAGQNDLPHYFKIGDTYGPDRYLPIAQDRLPYLPYDMSPEGKILMTHDDPLLQNTKLRFGGLYGDFSGVIFKPGRRIL